MGDSVEYFRKRFVEELNDDGLVTVRTFEWPPAEVLQTTAPHDYEAYFRDWVASEKQDGKVRAREFLKRYGCLDRFNRAAYAARSTERDPVCRRRSFETNRFHYGALFLRS
jgi:hypothetical protein